MDNPGYARLVRDRDKAIRGLIATSVTVKDGRVLDAGCGDASLGETVAQITPSTTYHGIDLQSELIDRARQRMPAGNLIVGSVDQLPYEDSWFDVVIAMTLFSSLPTVTMEAAAAREVARVTRPGGWLIWYDLRYDNPNNRKVHGISARRLATLFPDWRRELRTSTLMPPLARRLGPTTPVLYPVLEAIPFLRSHLIGRLRCPT
jgi:ubiquinone/menaquinone biosynthesis C-methylase UbiE